MVTKSAWNLLHTSESMDRKVYVGVVVTDPDNNKYLDPDKRQRLKIRIRGLHDELSDEELPWSAKGTGQDAGGGGMGSSQMYPKGTKVFVTLRDNSPYSPVYGGTAPTSDDTKIEEEFTGDDYGHVHGHIDRAGNKFSQNTKKDKNVTTFHHKSGTNIQILDDGTVSISSGSDITISGKQNVSVIAGNQLNLHAKQVNIAAENTTGISASSAILLKTPTVIGPPPVGNASPDSPASPSEAPARDRPNPNLQVT